MFVKNSRLNNFFGPYVFYLYFIAFTTVYQRSAFHAYLKAIGFSKNDYRVAFFNQYGFWQIIDTDNIAAIDPSFQHQVNR